MFFPTLFGKKGSSLRQSKLSVCGHDYSDRMKLHPEQTIGSLVAQHPEWGTLFETLGIDFCCGGLLTLEEAVKGKGLDLTTVTKMLEALPDAHQKKSGSNPAELDTPALIDHIVKQHHRYVREHLPTLLRLALKVTSVHGPKHREASVLGPGVKTLSQSLLPHLDEEEKSLFPELLKMAHEGGSLSREESATYLAEHEEAGRVLHDLRTVTGNFQVPAWGCNTYRLLMEGLDAFERDLHEHVHLENNVLFLRFGGQA